MSGARQADEQRLPILSNQDRPSTTRRVSCLTGAVMNCHASRDVMSGRAQEYRPFSFQLLDFSKAYLILATHLLTLRLACSLRFATQRSSSMLDDRPTKNSLFEGGTAVAQSVLDAIKMGIWDYEPDEQKQSTYTPTRALPGSDRKLAVLSARVESGLPLWHPEDRISYDENID